MADETIKRLKYFTGQYLEASDFLAEQDYHVDMRRRGNRALYYGAGILDGGFLVEIAKDDPKKITISSGIGIDADGCELIIITPRIESLPLAKTINQVFLITLEYSESPTDIQTVVKDNVNDATRMEEKLKIQFYEEEENNTIDRDKQIIVAQFTLNTDGKVVGEKFETNVRQNADARFPHNLTIGQGGNGILSVRHIDGKNWLDDAKDDLFLNYITGKNVHLGFGDNTKSSLFVSGNVGFGTQNPQAGLEIDKGNTNEVALLLNSSGAGWGSGVQFKNTAPQGKTYGIYSSASGKLHVSDQENTTDRLVIDKEGNVGIGTQDVKRTLHVHGSEIHSGGTAAGLSFGNRGSLFVDTPAAGERWVWYSQDGKARLWSGSDKLCLTSDGNIGIGTDVPEAKLHVHGDLLVQNNINLNSLSTIIYKNGRVMKKILGAGEFKAEGAGDMMSPSFYSLQLIREGNIIGNNFKDNEFARFSLYTNFNLPLRAVIDSVRICLFYHNFRIDSSDSSIKTLSCSMSLCKEEQIDTVPGWRQTIILPDMSYKLPLDTSNNNRATIISIPLINDASKRTVNSYQENFAIEIITIPGFSPSGNPPALYLKWVEINYTLYDTLSW